VVRINLRQQTAKPKYSELSDEEGEAAGEAPPQAWQPSPALFQQQAVVQQAFAQAAAPAPAAPTGQVAAAAAVQQAVGGQQWAVPDWVAHLPVAPAAAAPPAQAAPQAHAASTAAPQGWQPPPKPWERLVHQVPSATTLTAAKQSSGSGAWGGGGGGGAVQNHRSTPGFYAGAARERGGRVPRQAVPGCWPCLGACAAMSACAPRCWQGCAEALDVHSLAPAFPALRSAPWFTLQPSPPPSTLMLMPNP
jgi:hypothetical protein